MPPMMAPPGAPSFPGQVNGLPRPLTLAPPTTALETATTHSSSNGASTMSTLAPYQTDPAAPTSGGFDNFNAMKWFKVKYQGVILNKLNSLRAYELC
ncbi:hypothetical protein REPUB_Repub06bG0117100 [Reevesia pubescens]